MIGRGSFGVVHKAVWRGIIVAAKVLPMIGNQKSVDNELAIYRYEITLSPAKIYIIITGVYSTLTYFPYWVWNTLMTQLFLLLIMFVDMI